MVGALILPNPRNESQQKLIGQELLRLKDPLAFNRRLTEITAKKPFRRIYVMGCGRSGTWLLTQVLDTFKETDVVRMELPLEHFGLLFTSRPVLVIKRDHLAYQRIEAIPESIQIAYIIRHPFDVLTSHLPDSQRPYHILPPRWLGEMAALRYLVDTKRKQTKIIRYEDLVANPHEAQAELAGFFGLSNAMSMDDFYTSSTNQSEGPSHQARKLDLDSIGKHKRDPEKIRYLKEIKSELGQMLEWVGDRYRYDISL